MSGPDTSPADVPLVSADEADAHAREGDIAVDELVAWLARREGRNENENGTDPEPRAERDAT